MLRRLFSAEGRGEPDTENSEVRLELRVRVGVSALIWVDSRLGFGSRTILLEPKRRRFQRTRTSCRGSVRHPPYCEHVFAAADLFSIDSSHATNVYCNRFDRTYV